MLLFTECVYLDVQIRPVLQIWLYVCMYVCMPVFLVHILLAESVLKIVLVTYVCIY